NPRSAPRRSAREVPGVLTPERGPKVRRLHALLPVARVVNLVAVRDSAVRLLPCVAVSRDRLAANDHLPVPARHRSGPRQAPVSGSLSARTERLGGIDVAD